MIVFKYLPGSGALQHFHNLHTLHILLCLRLCPFSLLVIYFGMPRTQGKVTDYSFGKIYHHWCKQSWWDFLTICTNGRSSKWELLCCQEPGARGGTIITLVGASIAASNCLSAISRRRILGMAAVHARHIYGLVIDHESLKSSDGGSVGSSALANWPTGPARERKALKKEV